MSSRVFSLLVAMLVTAGLSSSVVIDPAFAAGPRAAPSKADKGVHGARTRPVGKQSGRATATRASQGKTNSFARGKEKRGPRAIQSTKIWGSSIHILKPGELSLLVEQLPGTGPVKRSAQDPKAQLDSSGKALSSTMPVTRQNGKSFYNLPPGQYFMYTPHRPTQYTHFTVK
jgi:hypothetical protein